MELANLRYSLEHKLLPIWFYDHKDAFVETLKKDGGKFPCMVMTELCAKGGQQMPYTEASYTVENHDLGNDMGMLVLNMPAPNGFTLCRRVYFVYDYAFEKLLYYTSEQSFDDRFALCAWTQTAEHVNYGPAPNEPKAERERVKELYFSLYA